MIDLDTRILIVKSLSIGVTLLTKFQYTRPGLEISGCTDGARRNSWATKIIMLGLLVHPSTNFYVTSRNMTAHFYNVYIYQEYRVCAFFWWQSSAISPAKQCAIKRSMTHSHDMCYQCSMWFCLYYRLSFFLCRLHFTLLRSFRIVLFSRLSRDHFLSPQNDVKIHKN